MLLDKTDKARDALRQGPGAGLGLQDRRILILVDGKRSLDAVMGLLGADILPGIDRLMREGYLARADAPARRDAARAPALGSAVTGLLRAATEAVRARTEQLRAATVATAATPPPTAKAPPQSTAPQPEGARRSLAASKMYLLDMLQLQRSAEAAELRATIQCAADADALVAGLVRGLRLIAAVSTPSYGERVARRLAEILPPEALPALEALRAERGTAPALAIVA